MRRSSRWTAAAASSLLACALLGTPAAAHPFGPPPTALVSADGDQVVIEWRAAPDDAIAVGVEVGLLPEELVTAYLEAPAQAAPAEAEELALSRSAELQDYLLEHIAVRQDGRRCEPSLEPVGNFVHEGARTVHRCPGQVDAVDITITVLHARHPAYRTFGISGDNRVNPQQAVFSAENPEHRWDFAAERASLPAREMIPWWALGTVLALAAVGVALTTVVRAQSSTAGRRSGST